ncbi:hypothetical protein HaLaN_30864 [Haematococcus lacustris]|uniref:Uncharacterized protein n=1 Tax=Haematococcus lacustris TaxID=44745 RepID=A0A6A0AGI7_HAELA|nr:hypothetical protein HaLaN_30864 [Haematococcus lacustris]
MQRNTQLAAPQLEELEARCALAAWGPSLEPDNRLQPALPLGLVAWLAHKLGLDMQQVSGAPAAAGTGPSQPLDAPASRLDPRQYSLTQLLL